MVVGNGAARNFPRMHYTRGQSDSVGERTPGAFKFLSRSTSNGSRATARSCYLPSCAP